MNQKDLLILWLLLRAELGPYFEEKNSQHGFGPISKTFKMSNYMPGLHIFFIFKFSKYKMGSGKVLFPEE